MTLLLSSLRVAERVWKEGLLLKEFPEESFQLKCLEDCLEFLETENAQQR